MKQSLLFLSSCCFFINTFSQSETRTANNVTINYNVASWLDRSAPSFAADDNVYAYTKTTSGQHPVFFDHFGFTIPSNATITSLVCTVRKFKSGRSEVKDLDGTTWFLARCYCSFTPDCNCDYGPVMHDLNAWSTNETAVNYVEAGAGTFTRTLKDQKWKDSIVTVNYAWTPDKINDQMFGFTFNPTVSIKGGGAAIYIDQLSVTVYYTVPAAKVATENTIRLKQYGNTLNVNARQSGKYSLTVTDRFGIILQQKILKNGINEQVELNNSCKGYCIITVEGNGQKKSMQFFIQ